MRLFLAVLVCLAVAGCTAPVNIPSQNAQSGSVDREPGGGGGGAGGM